MISQRYRVELVRTTGRSVLTSGGFAPEWISGVDVRAVPLFGLENSKLGGIYANTPGGQISFAVFGPESSRFVVGYEFTLTIP